MTHVKEIPVSRPADRDSLETLLKLNDEHSLTGLSDGVQAGYAFSPRSWRAEAESAVRVLAARGAVFTVDDLRRAGVADPDIPQRWGSLLAAMRNAGVLSFVGLSIHRTTGGASIPIRQWQGTAHSMAGGA